MTLFLDDLFYYQTILFLFFWSVRRRTWVWDKIPAFNSRLKLLKLVKSALWILLWKPDWLLYEHAQEHGKPMLALPCWCYQYCGRLFLPDFEQATPDQTEGWERITGMRSFPSPSSLAYDWSSLGTVVNLTTNRSIFTVPRIFSSCLNTDGFSFQLLLSSCSLDRE